MSLDINKPVQTRGGKKATIRLTGLKGEPIAYTIDDDLCEELHRTDVYGSFFGEGKQSPFDLINVPPPKQKVTGYVNIYRGANITFGSMYESSEPALRNAIDTVNN